MGKLNLILVYVMQVRLQLEVLLAEKSRLAYENGKLARENPPACTVPPEKDNLTGRRNKEEDLLWSQNVIMTNNLISLFNGIP